MLFSICKSRFLAQSTIVHQIRTATQKARSAPRKAARPTKAPVSASRPVEARPNVVLSESSLYGLQQRKVYAAQQLYDQGIWQIYTAPSHTFIHSVTWLVAVMFITNACRLAYERYDKLRAGHGLSRMKQLAVEGTNRLTMLFFIICGGYSLMRYRNTITSLQLIHGGQLRVSVRRFVPFLKPRNFLVPVYDLKLPVAWRAKSAPDLLPDDITTTGLISTIMFKPFTMARDFLTMKGFLAVTFENGTKKGLLDTRGTFNRSMADLDAIAYERQPWD